jgi:hypothetical protein
VAFRESYTQLLDERNIFEAEAGIARSRLELAESELGCLRKEWAEQSQIYGELLNININRENDNQVEQGICEYLYTL